MGAKSWQELFLTLSSVANSWGLMEVDDLRRLEPTSTGEHINPDVVGEVIVRIDPENTERLQVAQIVGELSDDMTDVQPIAAFIFKRKMDA